MIPIYRAKKMDNDEYVEGYLINSDDGIYISEANYTDEKNKSLDSEIGLYVSGCYEIDKSTLSIHFKDMTDQEGTKIFASLSEDGKGGDILEHPADDKFRSFTCVYDRWQIKARNKENGLFGFRLAFNNKITGIQQ